jgi:hypothetical protein
MDKENRYETLIKFLQYTNNCMAKDEKWQKATFSLSTILATLSRNHFS